MSGTDWAVLLVGLAALVWVIAGFRRASQVIAGARAELDDNRSAD